MMPLFIELVPKTAHFQNARSALTRSQWDRVKLATAEAADHKCEICGSTERVEAHEVWIWQEMSATTGIQYLARTVALCPWCHRAKHWGYTEGTGYLDATRRHILRVNNWTQGELEAHIQASWAEWVRLSKLAWTMDISVLDPVIADARRRKKRGAAALSQPSFQN
jgi:hypothetical protein